MEKIETFKVELSVLEETNRNTVRDLTDTWLGQLGCSSIEQILEVRAAIPHYCEDFLVERMEEWLQPPIKDGWRDLKFFGDERRQAAKFEFLRYEFESIIEPYTGHHIGIALAAVYNLTIHLLPMTAPHSVYLNEEGAPHIIGFEMEGVKTIFEPLRIDY